MENFVIYTTEDGKAAIKLYAENNTIWLNQAQMAELFQTTKQNISLHINNIFNEGELNVNSVVKEYLTDVNDGKSYSGKYFCNEMNR